MLVILWTDALVFLLLSISIIAMFFVMRNQQLRNSWRKLCQQPTRIISILVLVIFVLIGVLDSIHYLSAHTSKVTSVLDWILRPISQIQETSYSAPFAKHLFGKEMITDVNGEVTWVSQKLQYDHHVFGTDKIGTDVFYASLKSVRTGLILGTLTTIFTLPFAVFFGAMAGYLGGKVDDIIQYAYTTVSSIPSVLLIAAAMLSLDALIFRQANFFALAEQRSDARLLLLCAILGITSWTSLCRILRGETLKLCNQEYILSARALGASNWRIIFKHIFPNLLHIILISLVLDFSGLVLAEAVLTYIGVGVDPSMFSWGNMINSARLEMGQDPIVWWPLLGAFSLMFALVLAANVFADGVREVFDPRAA